MSAEDLQTQDPIRWVLSVPVRNAPMLCGMQLSQLGKSTQCKSFRIPYEVAQGEIEQMVATREYRNDPVYRHLTTEDCEEYGVHRPETWEMQFFLHYRLDSATSLCGLSNSWIEGLRGPAMIERIVYQGDTGMCMACEFVADDIEFVIREFGRICILARLETASLKYFDASDWKGNRKDLVAQLGLAKHRICNETTRHMQKGKKNMDMLLGRFHRKMEEDMQKVCAHCGSGKKKLQQCKGCGTVFYCDKSCQKSHWKYHRIACVGALSQ
jgi:hypothetical protein